MSVSLSKTSSILLTMGQDFDLAFALDFALLFAFVFGGVAPAQGSALSALLDDGFKPAGASSPSCGECWRGVAGAASLLALSNASSSSIPRSSPLPDMAQLMQLKWMNAPPAGVGGLVSGF